MEETSSTEAERGVVGVGVGRGVVVQTGRAGGSSKFKVGYTMRRSGLNTVCPVLSIRGSSPPGVALSDELAVGRTQADGEVKAWWCTQQRRASWNKRVCVTYRVGVDCGRE